MSTTSLAHVATMAAFLVYAPPGCTPEDCTNKSVLGSSGMLETKHWQVHFGSPNSERAISDLDYHTAREIQSRWNYYPIAIGHNPDKEFEFNLELRQDGNNWCAKFHDHINLQESPVGYGVTALDAIQDLSTKPDAIHVEFWSLVTDAHERLNQDMKEATAGRP